MVKKLLNETKGSIKDSIIEENLNTLKFINKGISVDTFPIKIKYKK